MQNLYWKSNSQSRTLVEKAFQTEMDFEKYLFVNQDLLGDVSIIYRQIKTGQKQGIPDMLGIDQDKRICIIELKNVTADEDILPQVLRYGIWAETNPDSIRAIWLESKTKPTDIEIDWDNLDIRLILVAPDFKSTVPKMAVKIGYPIDLVQIRRYSYEDDEFISVEYLEKPLPTKITTTKGILEWDWAYYESEHGWESTAQFKRVVDSIAELVKNRNWTIPYNINKYYVGFKIANKVAFNVAWGGTNAWNVKFKIPKESAENFPVSQWEFQNYSESFKEAIFRPKNPKTASIHELEPLFIEAYKKVKGD